MSSNLAKAEQILAEFAARQPETIEDHPWGHRAFKVRSKTFMFLSGEPGQLVVTVKLPNSSMMALTLPFASATGYGLGKSGWVSSTFAADDDVPTALICEWIDESFRAIAPKKLVAAKKPASAKKR